MEKKPVSFWIYLGIVFVAILLLTTLASLPLYTLDDSEAELISGTEYMNRLSTLSQQRISLGAVGVYLAACLLDIPFGLLATLLGALIGGLILGSYHYLIPMLLSFGGIFLLAKLAGLHKAMDWKSSLLVVLLCAGWTVLVYFLYDLLALGLGYHLACIGFVSHMGEGLLCAGLGLIMLRIKQTRMVEKGEVSMPIIDFSSQESVADETKDTTQKKDAPEASSSFTEKPL